MKKFTRVFPILLTTTMLLLPPVLFAQDTDGDGMPDSHESFYSCLMSNTVDSAVDFDSDLMTNLEEFTYNPVLNPCEADTDNDGMPDGWEITYACAGILPLTGDSVLDGDTDGLTNLDEYAADADPCDEDTDDGGEDDGSEVMDGRDALDPGDDLQFMTVGDGTSAWEFPLAAASHDARTQSICLSSEIGRAGRIYSLALDVTAVPGQILEDFTIRMRHTTLTSYSTASWQDTGWTTVYQNNQVVDSTGWNTFQLTTPFDYNLVDNLMVDISFNNTNGSSDGLVRGTQRPDNRTLVFRTDSGYGNPLSWSGSTPPADLSSFVPNIRLGISMLPSHVYGWAKRMGSEEGDQGYGIVADADGNSFVIGYFEGAVNFAEDFGGDNSKTSAGENDIFLTRINADGSYGWTRGIGGTGGDAGYEIAIDAGGNLFITGYFDDTVNFAEDFGGSDIKTSAGMADIFVTRVNADGSYAWTRTMGGADYDYGRDIAVGPGGDVFVVGYFRDSVDFAADFGGSDVKNSAGSDDIFVVRINADGSYGWARRVGGASSDRGHGVAVDANSQVAVTGSFQSTVNFAADFGSSDPKTSAGGADVFLSVLGANGSYGWTRRMGGTSSEYGTDSAVDADGNIFLSGYFYGTVNFAADFGGTDSKAAGSQDAFLTRVNEDGSYGWTRRIGGSGAYDGAYGVCADSNGNVFFTGFYMQTVNFAADFGGSDSKTSVYGRDVFITRVNADGTYGWTRGAGGNSTDTGEAVAINPRGDLFITGYFRQTVNFRLDFGGNEVKSAPGFNDETFVMSILVDSEGDLMADQWEDPYPCVDSSVLDGFLDPDLDGLNSQQEYQHSFFLDPCNPDTEGDGLSDGDEVLIHQSDPLDPETDGDGLSDYDEVYVYNTDPAEPDTDGDGLSDGDEVAVHGTSPIIPDSDDDGLQDGDEVSVHHTSPLIADTDGDGLSDGDEVSLHGTSPIIPDTDGDGLPDGFEVNASNTDPLVVDTDSDGLNDSQEIMFHDTNPNDADTDDDGLSDYDESITYVTNPWLIDSDDDGVSDWSEINVTGTDPMNPDSDNDGVPDGGEVGSTITDNDDDGLPGSWEDDYNCVSDSAGDSTADPDADGLDNAAEYAAGTDPCSPDTDADGLCDGSILVGETCAAGEVTRGTDPTNPDTDGDGLSDLVETDTGTYTSPTDTGTDPTNSDHDGDGFADGAEVSAGTDPCDAMSFPPDAEHLINYQGRLADAMGAPTDGDVAMSFRLFGVLEGGTALWEESRTVTVTNGIYNVLLGSVTKLDPADFNANPLYLEVEVDGEVMSPRTRITSVPLAIKAEELLGGRLEVDTRPINMPPGAESVTVPVSFRRAFSSPPKVVVSCDILGVYAVGNVTTTGFELTFAPVKDATTGAFTYQAFGQ